eukprot:TRINITY_DN36431_c0_g1_i2.p2 TRINITY_DN36431_c0_g1~~TRINITY_DN36431_c0_g1_i2.p2  ORF type:complete len:280 (+),score=53.07 TRINITY_DN36431_c0_g1_i2:60-842(+)
MRRKRAAGGAGPAQRPPKRGRGGAAGEAIAVPGMAPGVRDFDQAMEGAGCGDSDDDLGVAGRLFELANSSAVRFSVGGQSVTVVQQPSVEGTGGVIWETSYALAIQLAPLLQQAPGALRVLEVGAGCGLCGIALARLGADVVVTEQESAMGNLGENVRRNAPAGSEAPYRCRPLRLAWGHLIGSSAPTSCSPSVWWPPSSTPSMRCATGAPRCGSACRCAAPRPTLSCCGRRRGASAWSSPPSAARGWTSRRSWTACCCG